MCTNCKGRKKDTHDDFKHPPHIPSLNGEWSEGGQLPRDLEGLGIGKMHSLPRNSAVWLKMAAVQRRLGEGRSRTQSGTVTRPFLSLGKAVTHPIGHCDVCFPGFSGILVIFTRTGNCSRIEWDAGADALGEINPHP